MARDPAFLFYYDRFQSATMTMTDAEVGQYIRLMCVQANKGHVTEKDLLHICKTLDTEVILKFNRLPDGNYVNLVLAEILADRRKFTESRRNNRKGAKPETSDELVNNTSETSLPHVVNVNKDIVTVVDKGGFEKNWDRAFGGGFLDPYKSQFPNLSIEKELQHFRLRCNTDPDDYHKRDTGGLRKAFLYQLKNAKTKANGQEANKYKIQ